MRNIVARTAGIIMAMYLSIGLIRSTPANAWGGEGHHTIGAIADRLLAGSNAERHVKDLLKGGTLEKYAVWADCAKGPRYCPKEDNGRTWFDAEMKAFAAKHKAHHGYHYTDIPYQESRYKEGSIGASQSDVVHVIEQCIDVLRDEVTPQSNPNKFDKRTALILLAHLVGDIHQPLHVGAGYVGESDKFINPNTSKAKYETTEGGNWLMRTKTGNLHHFWDTDVVVHAWKKLGASTPSEFAAAVGAPSDWRYAGDPASWPPLWATESLILSKKTFGKIVLGKREQVQDKQSGKEHLQWSISGLPGTYVDTSTDDGVDQLAKAGYRLAAILKAVWP